MSLHYCDFFLCIHGLKSISLSIFFCLAYDVPVLARNLDWIALMTYDYHGQWDKKTGHVAPMYARDGDDDKTFNAV